VCGGANDQTSTAFLINTLVMSLLPLGMLFGGAYLVWSYNRPRQRRRIAQDPS
jgi:hypothetical protein